MKQWDKGTESDHFFGTEVKDPFRWLEDDNSSQTKAWTAEQKRNCQAYFEDSEMKQEDVKRLQELWDYTKYGVPEKAGETLFYRKAVGLENQPKLYRKWKATERVVLDPNMLSEDGTIALIQTSFSKDGRYLAYTTSVDGSDQQQIRILDLDTGLDLPEKIDRVKFTNIAWSPDNSGFYYSRFPDEHSVPEEDLNNFNKVYYHTLHTFQHEDELVFEQAEDKELLFTPGVTDDGRYVYLHVSRGTSTANRFYYKEAGSSSFIRLFDDEDAKYQFIGNIGSKYYLLTDFKAPKGRIISVDTAMESNETEEVVPEKQNVLESVKFAGEHLIACYVEDVKHALHIYRPDGMYVKEVEMPVKGSITGISGNADNPEVYFGVTTYLNPGIIYKYDLNEDALSEFAMSEVPAAGENFTTEQFFITSEDGTDIPMSLTYSNDTKNAGSRKVILSAYGGFNISLMPAFNPAVIKWIEDGGIFAVANLRGGGEYGEEWHKQGMLENKQNVFDDFIAASKWLIEKKYTTPDKLAVMGGSNGGLLTAAVMIQRPDLFGAVISRVPVIDMLRYHTFTIGRYWIPEYGNPEIEEHFNFLIKYSPLHNIKQGEKYPPVLIATAESDDRVVPAHARKFTAALNDGAHPDSKVILRLEEKAGHGLGKPAAKIIEEWADYFSFLNKELK